MSNVLRKVLFISVLALALVALAACGSQSSSTQASAPASFSKDVLPILQANCTACHGSDRPAEGLDLSSYASVSASGAVNPGNAGNSALVKSVESGRMPQGGPKLSKADIQKIKDWINAGAQDN
jgi:mono/diheme cytochrome c family protein